jgi:putative DNA primase/helicase
MARESEFGAVADFAAKTADNAARIAGVFHVLQYGPIGEIAAETLVAAAALAVWHLNEAKRILGAVGAPGVSDAQLLIEWLLTQDGDVGPRAISQFGPSRVRDRARRDEAIEALIEKHHIAEVKVDGATVLRVNPKLRGPQ